ncbi:hypothetical protein ES706_00195 [subsurface metagenome]|nr:hypothetical protein [Hadesarchaea archaeon]
MEEEDKFKAIKVAAEAYNKLFEAKKLAVMRARQEKNTELTQALMAMGIGAFAGWLIFRAIKNLENNR